MQRGRLSCTGLRWRRTKEPLLFWLGLGNRVLLCSLCSFVLWTLIISDPVYETPAMQSKLVHCVFLFYTKEEGEFKHQKAQKNPRSSRRKSNSRHDWQVMLFFCHSWEPRQFMKSLLYYYLASENEIYLHENKKPFSYQ